MKEFAGVLAMDLIRYVPALLSPRDNAYLMLRNRSEKLEQSPDGSGFRCQWQWTSELHAPKVIPALGRRLMQRALSLHPIHLKEAPEVDSAVQPQVSFLIGHRGVERLAHLQATLRSIAAQQGVPVECIVVEQDVTSCLGPLLPPWVRLIHTPPPAAGMPYCRTWAFNVAAQHARSPVFVLHDNDMLVPQDYAVQILDRIQQGYEVVNLKRFIFYLSRTHTDNLLKGRGSLLASAPDSIVQNLEGGGSVAITRSGFERIGGMDESFVGWGGEDNEFWERAQTLRSWPWGSLSLVHLFHPAQPGKHDAQYTTARRYRELTQISPSERVRRLAASPRGNSEGPSGWTEAPGGKT